MDQASIHMSAAIQDKRDEWKARNIYIFVLLTYAPELKNLIEILWRFMKYEWLEVEAYKSWESLRAHVETMLREFEEEFVINFV